MYSTFCNIIQIAFTAKNCSHVHPITLSESENIHVCNYDFQIKDPQNMLLILMPLYRMNYIILYRIICNLNATSQLPLLHSD